MDTTDSLSHTYTVVNTTPQPQHFEPPNTDTTHILQEYTIEMTTPTSANELAVTRALHSAVHTPQCYMKQCQLHVDGGGANQSITNDT